MILSLLFTLLSLPLAEALPLNASACLSRERVAEVNRDFTFVSNIEAEKVSDFDLCDQELLITKVYRAILFLKDLPPLTIQRDRFDQGILEGTPYEFFKKRVKAIRLEPDSNPDCHGGDSAAFVKPGRDHVMHVCAASQPGELLWIATTLIHEARHVDGYPHKSFCSHGRLQGNPGCDDRYDYRGAYSAEVEFNVRLSRTEALPPEIRHQARGLAVMTLLENINETPFGVRPGFVLQDVDGNVSFFDGERVEEMFRLAHPDDLLVLRAQMPTVYSYRDGNVRSYLNKEYFVDTDGSYAALFRSLETERERRSVLDVVYHKKSSCILYPDRITCSRLGFSSTVTFTSILPKSLTVLADRIAVVDQDGYAYPISHEIVGQPELNESRLSPTMRPIGVESLAVETFTVHLGIGLDGVVRRFSALGDPTQPGIEVPALAGKRFKRVLGVVWWSSEIAGF